MTAAKKKAGKSRAKGKTQPRHYLRWILIIILLVLVYAFFTGPKSVIRLYEFYQTRNELYLEKQRLEAENKRLLEEIERLENDLKHIEKVAREKYNLKREDEDVYEVVPQ